ncbi:MAG: UxaA family hydrolase [Chloroflexota bacterium]
MVAARALVIGSQDNVATALQDVEVGGSIAARREQEVTPLVALEAIPFGFKVALRDIAQGEPIYKYGEVIGKASQPIKKGELVHIHNVEGNRGRGDLAVQETRQ